MNELFETIEAIRKEQQFKAQELVELGVKFLNLKSQYKATTYNISWKSSPLYFILSRLESENKLTDPEVQWLKSYGLTETIAIAQQMEQFATLKAKYKATKHQDLSPVSRLYRILKQLEAKEQLRDSDVTWLKEYELCETLEIFQRQEAAREAEFAQLKDKYQATKHPDSSASSPLYPILLNLEAEKQLSESEIGWLEQHELTETLDIILEIEQKRDFAALKAKYKATQYEDLSPSSHLYKLLKRLESNNHLGEQDINFLKKRKLTETITIAQDKYAASLKSKIELGEQLEESQINWLKENGRENIIAIAQEKHFATLKSKYDVSDYKDKSPSSPLYPILQKLEKGQRLEPTDVAWLQANKTEWRQLFSGKISLTYHKIEATFYEQEYERTGNQWNLPNASSHWRKADKPKLALKLTQNLNFDKIKENKLKSALLTTRGGALRDIDAGSTLDMSNCQPFRSDKLLFVHNGAIANFQETLYRPIRSSLSDSTYRLIKGITDSEHIFALLCEYLQSSPKSSLLDALRATLNTLTDMAKEHDTSFSANIIVSDGRSLCASRYAYGTEAPTLYWSTHDVNHPSNVTVASEPLSNQKWLPFAPQSTLFVKAKSLQPLTSVLENAA